MEVDRADALGVTGVIQHPLFGFADHLRPNVFHAPPLPQLQHAVGIIKHGRDAIFLRQTQLLPWNV